MATNHNPNGLPHQPFPANSFIGGLTQPPFQAPHANGIVANDSLNFPVIGDTIYEAFIKNVMLAPLADIGTTLVGVNGSTIMHTKYSFIGPAFDIQEGVRIDTTKIRPETVAYQIKGVGHGIKFTREQMNHDGTLVTESVRQFAEAFADKLEIDLFNVARQAPTGGTVPLTREGMAQLAVAFGENSYEAVLLVSPATYARILGSDWIAHLRAEGATHLISGSLPTIFGYEIRMSNRVEDGEMLLIRRGALAVEYGQTVEVESQYDAGTRETEIFAHAQYVAYLKRESHLLQFTVGN